MAHRIVAEGLVEGHVEVEGLVYPGPLRRPPRVEGVVLGVLAHQVADDGLAATSRNN